MQNKNCNEISAGIVLFNPEINKLRKNLMSICNQVKMVYLIDNGSDNLKDIESLLLDFKNVSLHKFYCNYGIAKALNEICVIAQKNNYKWVITLDQDSVCADNLVEKYALLKKENSNIGQITCIFQDINFKKENEEFNGSKEIEWCITSGALLNIDAWRTVGGFDENLFIDAVDYDICLSMREHGFKIVQAGFIGLFHEIGDGHEVKIGPLTIKTWNHSAFRRYYSTRNMLIVAKKHHLGVLRCLLGVFKHIILIFVFEDNRIEKLKKGLLGVDDGLRY